jgi:hypothetical protein
MASLTPRGPKVAGWYEYLTGSGWSELIWAILDNDSAIDLSEQAGYEQDNSEQWKEAA